MMRGGGGWRWARQSSGKKAGAGEAGRVLANERAGGHVGRSRVRMGRQTEYACRREGRHSGNRVGRQQAGKLASEAHARVDIVPTTALPLFAHTFKRVLSRVLRTVDPLLLSPSSPPPHTHTLLPLHRPGIGSVRFVCTCQWASCRGRETTTKRKHGQTCRSRWNNKRAGRGVAMVTRNDEISFCHTYCTCEYVVVTQETRVLLFLV